MIRVHCNAEGCQEPLMAGGEGLCERHTEDLRRSRAFYGQGRLKLDPMSPSQAQLGLSGSRKEQS